MWGLHKMRLLRCLLSAVPSPLPGGGQGVQSKHGSIFRVHYRNMRISTLKIDRYHPFMMQGFSNFSGLFQVIWQTSIFFPLSHRCVNEKGYTYRSIQGCTFKLDYKEPKSLEFQFSWIWCGKHRCHFFGNFTIPNTRNGWTNLHLSSHNPWIASLDDSLCGHPAEVGLWWRVESWHSDVYWGLHFGGELNCFEAPFFFWKAPFWGQWDCFEGSAFLGRLHLFWGN